MDKLVTGGVYALLKWLAQECEYEPKIPGRHKVGLSIVANERETGAEVHQDSGVYRDLPQRARGWACSVRMAPVLDRQAAALLDHDAMWRDRG